MRLITETGKFTEDMSELQKKLDELDGKIADGSFSSTADETVLIECLRHIKHIASLRDW